MTDPKCGALTRKATPCTQPAGWGTNHTGTGRCMLHGSGSKEKPAGGRPGNKNALKTGEYETLYFSALSPEEQILYEQLDIQPLDTTVNSLKLTCIREHRILIRIRRAEEASEISDTLVSSITTHKGWNVQGKVDYSVTQEIPALEPILRLEDSLTRVQAVKARYIDQLRGVLKENPQSSGGLEAIVQAVTRSAAKIAAAKEAQRELDQATSGLDMED